TVAAIPPQTLAIDCERVPQEAASTACVESNFVQGGRKVLSCDLHDKSQAFLDPVLPAKQLLHRSVQVLWSDFGEEPSAHGQDCGPLRNLAKDSEQVMIRTDDDCDIWRRWPQVGPEWEFREVFSEESSCADGHPLRFDVCCR